jgi:predicted TIM-barrel fold metal-dependent hydrolase
LDTEIIDAHVHLYRDAKAEKLGLPIPGRRGLDRWGNADAITVHMDREGVSHVVSLNLFPTPVIRRALLSKLPSDLTEAARAAGESQVEADLANRLRRHNEWLCNLSMKQPRVVAGIGIQKLLTSEEMVVEVEVRAVQGARAVKIIPGWYHEFPNDRAFWPMYSRCEELGLPIASDTGSLGLGVHAAYPGEYNKICYGEPLLFEDVLVAFPRLTVVMCHFGSAYWDERVELAQRYQNLVFDISGGFYVEGLKVRDSQRALSEVDAVRVMRRVGMERFMFGSDGPHVMLQPYLEQALRLDLTDGERRMLLVENARRVYNIPM